VIGSLSTGGLPAARHARSSATKETTSHGQRPSCDGLEYVNSSIISGCTGGVLISNRGDAKDPYDAYPILSAASCNPSFITPPPGDRNSGIAWDGQLFYTSDTFSSPTKLNVFNSNGTSYTDEPTITVTGIPPSYPAVIEDLSSDYARIYCFPPGHTVYSNGPVNGQFTSYLINGVVSNSFVISPSSSSTAINGFCFGAWVSLGSAPQDVTWSITSKPAGGVTYASGTATKANGLLSADFLFDNNNATGTCYQHSGCSVYQAAVSFASNVTLVSGTYYLNLTGGSDDHGEEMFWDTNFGTNCSSPGCPSTAWYNDGTISIPSESFIIR
jgi:hypothetical protein